MREVGGRSTVSGSLPALSDPALGFLDDSHMSGMTVSAAREDFAGVIEPARRSGGPAYVTRRGHRMAVSVEDVHRR